jgi:hypothetical protein
MMDAFVGHVLDNDQLSSLNIFHHEENKEENSREQEVNLFRIYTKSSPKTI